MILKILNSKKALSTLLVGLIIALVLLAITVPLIANNRNVAENTIEGVFNCKNPLGWNGKCIPAYESCAKYKLKDWSNLPIYENACYDKSNPDTKDLKCCMYTEDPSKEMFMLVEPKGEEKGAVYLKDGDGSTKVFYTGGSLNEKVEAKLTLYNIKNNYLPSVCDHVSLSIQFSNLKETTPCITGEEQFLTCKVKEDDGNVGSCTFPDMLAVSDPEEKYLTLQGGGCYFTIIGYSENEEVVFSDDFWVNVIQNTDPSNT